MRNLPSDQVLLEPAIRRTLFSTAILMEGELLLFTLDALGSRVQGLTGCALLDNLKVVSHPRGRVADPNDQRVKRRADKVEVHSRSFPTKRARYHYYLLYHLSTDIFIAPS
jgi:hypothetical protein